MIKIVRLGVCRSGTWTRGQVQASGPVPEDRFKLLAGRATEASLADGGGSGPARYQRIGAVGRAAGAVEARETHRKLKFVLLGPGGVGKSTLALKFAAGKVERGGGWLLLVFRLSASTMEQDYAGLLDDMLGKGAVRAPSYAAEEGG